jgi:hypothetical protein
LRWSHPPPPHPRYPGLGLLVAAFESRSYTRIPQDAYDSMVASLKGLWREVGGFSLAVAFRVALCETFYA